MDVGYVNRIDPTRLGPNIHFSRDTCPQKSGDRCFVIGKLRRIPITIEVSAELGDMILIVFRDLGRRPKRIVS